MVRGDPKEVLVGGVGTHTLKENPHLELPTAKIGPEQLGLLRIDDFDHSDGLAPRAEPQLTFASHANIANPLRQPSRCDQIPVAVMGQQVDRRRSPFAAGPSPNGKDAGAIDADSGESQQRDKAIEDIGGEPVGPDITIWDWRPRSTTLLGSALRLPSAGPAVKDGEPRTRQFSCGRRTLRR